jgi:low temperature requirement protein LtrA
LNEIENTRNNENRRATWLELFYDLVFVVIIFQLARNLEEDFSLNGFLGFLAFFVLVWWSWTGAVFYATRFDTDDLGHRILILYQKHPAQETSFLLTPNQVF